MSDREKLMALRDASVDARRKAALGLDMGDPSSLETLTRTHIVVMALDAVPDGVITQARFGCGPGRTLVAGRCVARTTIRHTRRAIRREYY